LRQAGQQPQQAGLADAVGPAHVQPLARFQREVDPGEQGAFAADTGQAMSAQHVAIVAGRRDRGQQGQNAAVDKDQRALPRWISIMSRCRWGAANTVSALPLT
jgi:hypothetical protein